MAGDPDCIRGDGAAQPFVTLSASYGAGGSRIGPRLADRLGVSFYDRAIPRAVARRLAVPLDAALAHDEPRRGTIERLLASFAPLGALYGAAHLSLLPDEAIEQDAYRAAADRVIEELARRGGGVLLGRAGAVVLRGHAHVLHVRLSGPLSARLAAAVSQGIDERAAAEELRQTDRARETYLRELYGADANDPGLYHLVLDSTALGEHACVALIVQAARARLGVVEDR